MLDRIDTAATETAEPRGLASAALKARTLLVRITVTALIVGVVFIALEVLLEQYYWGGPSQKWTTFHPERGWALVPGDYWVKSPRELKKIAVHVNPLGLRSRDYAGQTPKGRSVTILGDSFVFASASTVEESFPQRLENVLNQRTAGGAEVINAGVPGYGTAQELLLLRELLHRYHVRSDVYLLMFFTNDILDNLCLSEGQLQSQPVRPCFTLDASGKPWLAKAPEYIPNYQDDALVTARPGHFGQMTAAVAQAWVEQRLQSEPRLVAFFTRLGMSPQVARMPGIVNAWYRSDVLRKGVPLTAALLAQMKQEIEQQNGQLIVSMVPSAFQLYHETYVPLLKQTFSDPAIDDLASDLRRPQRLVREMCEKVGVPYQDLLPILLEHRETPLVIPRDGHLTRAGHKVVSEALLPFVLEHLRHNDATNSLSHSGRPR